VDSLGAQILTTVMMRVIVDKNTDHAKPHFDLIFTILSTSKKVFFRARPQKGMGDTAVLSGLLSIQRQISQSDCEISSNCS